MKELYDDSYFAAQVTKSDEKIAWQYGRLLNFAGVEARGARILDAGCGAGPALRYLAQRGFVPFGSDMVEYPLTLTRRFVPEARLAQCDLDRELPYSSGAFDLVLLSEVLEHVAQPEFTLRECRRILRGGGAVALTTPNTWDARRIYFPALGKVWSGDADPTHRQLFNPATLRRVLTRAGFKNVRVRAGFKPLRWVSSRRFKFRVAIPGLPLVGNTLLAAGYK
jgi:2-polyprenyl-3-methyl-5-hydroxy-6-metoxy-1,4-benzoquinol methylase